MLNVTFWVLNVTSPSPQSIKLTHIIGEGEFGSVYKGSYMTEQVTALHLLQFSVGWMVGRFK